MIRARLHHTAVAAVLLAISGGLLAAPAPKAKAFVTVNGKAVSQAMADAFIHEQVAQGRTDNEELRQAVREELARREAVAQVATAKGLEKNSEVQARLQLARQEALIRAFIGDYIKKNPVSEKDVKDEYEKIKNDMVVREFKSRHVLVETEDEAKDIITKLDAGEKFDELAKASKDPGSKDNGGDLGWNRPNAFVEPFSRAMIALEKGKYTKTPVKSQFGYHVIQLDDSRMSEPPPFEAIQAQLTQHLQQQKIGQLITDIQQKAKVE